MNKLNQFASIPRYAHAVYKTQYI